MHTHISGKYDNTTDTASSSCPDCAPGFISKSGSTQCSMCPAGMYADAVATVSVYLDVCMPACMASI